MGTQERSQETGNDSRRKRPFQKREDRYHQASIKEKRGMREWEREKKEDTTSSKVAGKDKPKHYTQLKRKQQREQIFKKVEKPLRVTVDLVAVDSHYRLRF